MIRLIPVLLIKGNGLVKTTNFKNPVYIGDPINAVRIFNEKEVDELILCDIEANTNNVGPNYVKIKNIISESFMPVAYGGGVNTIEHFKKIFELGVEKIILNTAALNFDLISKAASIFGSQSIVVSIDVKKSIFGKYYFHSRNGTVKHNWSPEEFAKKVIDAGAGELVVQSIDKEGTMSGFDLELTKAISNLVEVPVVASGGAGNISHISDVVKISNASAVAAGSYFVYKGKHNAVLINYPSQDEIAKINS